MSLAIKMARASSQGGRSGVVQEGGILDFFKGIIKTGTALVTRGPLAALGVLGGGEQRPPIGPSKFSRAAQQQVPAPGALAAGQRFFPGGATGMMTCPSGFHPNKQGYFLKSGSWVEEGSRCVKNRRRNPMNPRALDRAIGRVDGGKRLQHRLAQIETSKYSKAGNRKAHHHG